MADNSTEPPPWQILPRRTCHFCDLPIPDDERSAIEARTRNGWAHFECWYDGAPMGRDPVTGRQATRDNAVI